MRRPSRQPGKTAARGCVAPAALLLLRLRGGVRTLAEGEWEALHEEAGDKLVGTARFPFSRLGV